MSEAVLDVAALDASATAVEAETPAIETPAEVPAEKAPVEAGVETAKTEEGKPADKTVVTDSAPAPITPKQIVEQLQELKKTNEPLAKAIHSHVKQGLESQRFLKEVGAKDFAEAKTLLSKPDAETAEMLDAVRTTDEILYRGDLKELTNNILEDITSELGDAAPSRLSEFSETLLEKIAEVDPAGSTRIQRAAFLAASDTSGLINSLNKLNGYISSGDTKSAVNLLKGIGKFFSEEIAANENVAKTRTEAKATAEKEATATTTKLRSECMASVDKSMNVILGGFLSPFLKDALKGTPRPELESLAAQIKAEAKSALGKDAAYVKEIDKLYQGLKTPAQKDRLTQKFEAALKKDDFGKKLVERVCREKFPEKFKASAAPAAKPTTVKTTINGKPAEAFVFKARPTNLLHEDIVWKGQQLTSRDLSTLQATRQQGFVLAKDGKTPVLISWKAGK